MYPSAETSALIPPFQMPPTPVRTRHWRPRDGVVLARELGPPATECGGRQHPATSEVTTGKHWPKGEGELEASAWC